MNRILYIPARSPAAAERIAYAIDEGRIACSIDYLSPSAAATRAAFLSTAGNRHGAYEAKRVASPDGWVRVARLINNLGDVAAALLLVTLAPMAAAAGWGWLS